jgi:methylenetetrahydrofolate dehydrogenase (NADP+) / methenyltetrahydrofolate cyclohydrolase
MKLIDGKAIAAEIHHEVAIAIAELPGRQPGLTAILVGDDPASATYVATKRRACEAVGIRSQVLNFASDITHDQLLAEIERLNDDPSVDGILIQLPLPPQVQVREVIATIDPTKDVDGFHPVNMGKALIGETTGFAPCTPAGIVELLKRSHVPTSGKHAVIIGRSNIVGKPLAALLVQKGGPNATVTIAHSGTDNLTELCRSADILVAAIGRPHTVTAEMVKEGAVVIDVGINRIDAPENSKGYQVVGDVDFDEVAPKTSLITPVPGGVGPMTVAMLLHNTLKSHLQRHR